MLESLKQAAMELQEVRAKIAQLEAKIAQQEADVTKQAVADPTLTVILQQQLATLLAKEERLATTAYLDTFAAFLDEVRALARAKADPKDIVAVCDRLRDSTLVELGVRLEDKPDGTAVWKLDDPAAMKAEQEERARQAAEAARKKLQTHRFHAGPSTLSAGPFTLSVAPSTSSAGPSTSSVVPSILSIGPAHAAGSDRDHESASGLCGNPHSRQPAASLPQGPSHVDVDRLAMAVAEKLTEILLSRASRSSSMDSGSRSSLPTSLPPTPAPHPLGFVSSPEPDHTRSAPGEGSPGSPPEAEKVLSR